ncbi:MAG: catalase [Pseudomonadota bacterium]
MEHHRSKFWVAFVALSVFVTQYVLAEPELSYPSVDASLGEYLHSDEQHHALAIGDIVEKDIRDRYAESIIQRDAHPKAHGCPVAQFKVLDDIPEHLQAGVFQPGAVYDTVVRFSNGSPNAKQADAKGDTRGMAIKLSGVVGAKLVDIDSQADHQDFLLISHPVFFVNDAEDYAEFFEITASGQWWRWLKLPFVLGVRGSYNAYQMLRKKIDNPLATRYWSVVPYQLGEGKLKQLVKYSAKPCQPLTANDGVSTEQDDYLRAAMTSTLESASACMSFMVQEIPRGDYSVEDVVSRWPEDKSPFNVVAELHFKPQVFDSDDQLERCEAMAFNPWHGLEAHRPLGAVNRIRKVVYDRIRRIRQSSY